MTSDLDVYRSAQLLIREHGEDTGLEAAQRADAMLEKGDLDGERVWLKILKATEELLNSRPSKRAAIH